MASDIFFTSAPVEHQKREKNKARELRKSPWWKNQLGKGKCYYCEARFPPKELTMDYLVPIARGGKTTKSNVVVSCKECNNEKKYHTPEEMALKKLED